MATKKENHRLKKQSVRRREKELLRNSHSDPEEIPNQDVTLGKVCRRGWGSGIIKK